LRAGWTAGLVVTLGELVRLDMVDTVLAVLE